MYKSKRVKRYNLDGYYEGSFQGDCEFWINGQFSSK